VQLTPAGRLFVSSFSWASGSNLCRVELRDGAGKEILYSQNVEKGIGQVCVIGPDDRHVYISTAGKNVYRWTPAANEVVLLFRQSTNVTGLVISPDEQTAVTTGGNKVYVYSLPDGEKKRELKHPMLVGGAAPLSGNRLLTACNDGVVRLWDLSGGRELLALELGMGKITCLAVSPDQMIFAAGVQKGDRIVLMDVPD
jgi:WD40 repeat protein